MTWKILAMAAVPILVATVATIWIAAAFDDHVKQIETNAAAYVKMLEDSTLSHDAKMSDLQTQLDEALAQLEAAEQRTIASADEFEARLSDFETTATARLESFGGEIDTMRQSVSVLLVDAAKENSDFRDQLQKDVKADAAERLTAAENAANAEISSAVSYAKSNSDEIQNSAAESLAAVKREAADYLAQTGVTLQNQTGEQQRLVRNFVDEQTALLEGHVNVQKQNQTKIAEELRNSQASFVEAQDVIDIELRNNQESFVATQKAEQQQFIEEQTAAREAMRTQTEEIAAALSEGRPMSWAAIDYTSAAEPRQEGEVVRVFGRGTSVDTQFAQVNVTENTIGEAGVIGVAVEPVDSLILSVVQLPDERFRMNRAVGVRFYKPNSSQPEESNPRYHDFAANGKIRFNEDGINCNKTKAYSYRLNTNVLTELGDGCGWFDFPNEAVATRIYILAENVQD